jgi:hypothetical protein
MIEFIMSFKRANISIKNRQELTPFALAAKLARKKIFHYFLSIKKNNLFLYADIACNYYNPKEIDSIDTDGMTNYYSALNLVIHEVNIKI